MAKWCDNDGCPSYEPREDNHCMSGVTIERCGHAIIKTSEKASKEEKEQNEAGYIVSVVVVKYGADGYDCKNGLYYIETSNEDEARGIAVSRIMGHYPKHQILSIVMPADKYQQVKEEEA